MCISHFIQTLIWLNKTLFLQDEEEQQQEDQETTPKRTARRGRPSRAAAPTDDLGKDI